MMKTSTLNLPTSVRNASSRTPSFKIQERTSSGSDGGMFLRTLSSLNSLVLVENRICPGRFMAENSLYAAMVKILAVFNISKALDANGREITPKLEFDWGIVWCVIH